MIAEVILITELLRQTVGTPISTSRAPSPIPYEAPTKAASLVGNLFAVGPTTEIKQSFTLPPLAPSEIATAYLEASTGRPESIAKKLETGRL